MTKTESALLVILVVYFTACLASTSTVAQSIPRKAGNSLTTKSTQRYTKTTALGSRPHQTTEITISMDDSNQCSVWDITNYFYTSEDTALVQAWTSGYRHRPIVGTCSLTIAAYPSYGLTYSFPTPYENVINDCSVTLNIYSGTSAYDGTRLNSYSCIGDLPTAAQHIRSGYITIELVNNQGSNNYDFTLLVENHNYLSGGDIAGIVIGSFVSVTIIIVVLCLVRQRRQRMYTRGPVLIAATITTTSCRTGAAPFPPNNYGSVSTSSN